MAATGGFASDVKDRPHLRVICIPITVKAGLYDTGYVLPAGSRILSHTTFTLGGVTHMKLVVDTSNIRWCDEPEMPADWDYRDLLRGGVSPVRRRGGRAA